MLMIIQNGNNDVHIPKNNKKNLVQKLVQLSFIYEINEGNSYQNIFSTR